jgi:hypothetical protein
MAASFCFAQESCAGEPSKPERITDTAKRGGQKSPEVCGRWEAPQPDLPARHGASLAWLPERGDQGARQRLLFLPLAR